MRAPRSARTIRSIASLALLATVCPVAVARAQRVTLAREASLLSEPGGHALATIVAGATVNGLETKGAWTRVALDGWIVSAALGAKRDSFDVSARTAGARLRAGADKAAAVIASLEHGMGLHVVARAGEWVHVTRAAWVRTKQLAPTTVAAQPAQKAQSARPTGPAAVAVSAKAPAAIAQQQGAQAISDEALAPLRAARLMSSPDGQAIATIGPGAVATPVARDRDWVKVRLEGWVRAGDMVAANPGSRALTAADLRADPAAAKGRIVRWTIQKLQLLAGDGLRSDIAVDEPYLLARGPGSENALLYIVVPPDLVAQARALSPMTNVTVTARVRAGRSEPSGVPVLELRAIEH